MGKLIYAMNVSVDGFVSDAAGNFDWSVPTPELMQAFNDLERPIGTYLYGRKLYETMAVWDTAHLSPDSTPFAPGLLELEREFATLWRSADKIVFSTTLAAPTTPRTRIERRVDPDHIRTLKATSTRDLTVGGPDLAAAMLAHEGLVDELQAFIHPIIVGGGHPWLPRDLRLPLALAAERRIGPIVHLRYTTT
jgi:dihydrofolate reductase